MSDDEKRKEWQIEDLFRYPVSQKRIEIVHLQMVKESRWLYGPRRFISPQETVDIVRPLVNMADRELVLVMSLNTKLEPMAVEIVSIGGLDFCNIDVSNVFKHAILSNASCIICFHNHPSGDPTPSKEDRVVNKRLAEAGRLLGVQLLDNIIIGESAFYSFREQDDADLEIVRTG